MHPPAHVAVVSIPAPGHVNPSLEVVRTLVARGHRVTYANDEAVRTAIEATGAVLLPYRSSLPEVNHEGAAGAEDPWAGDVIDQLTLFQDDYEHVLPQLRALYDDDRPDVFLYDIASVPARILADTWGVPAVQLSPTYVAWEGYEDDTAELTATIEGDPRGRDLRARERRMLDEAGISTDGPTYLGRPPRCIALIARSMQPHADRVDEQVVTFVGPTVRPGAQTGPWEPVRPLEPGTRVLLVSLGTAFVDRPDFYRRCLAAFGDLAGWYLVLQVGPRVTVDDLLDEGSVLPTNVEVHPWVPQAAVLHRADAFVTHAGMGGSSEGLVTATPMIAAPQDVDQFQNADHLVAAGVAVRVDSATVSPSGLRAALADVDRDEVRARSRALATEVAAAGGAEAAADVVEEVLAARRAG